MKKITVRCEEKGHLAEKQHCFPSILMVLENKGKYCSTNDDVSDNNGDVVLTRCYIFGMVGICCR